jgi:hypothetical protein
MSQPKLTAKTAKFTQQAFELVIETVANTPVIGKDAQNIAITLNVLSNMVQNIAANVQRLEQQESKEKKDGEKSEKGE